jgi:predicted nucleic acid-binding protein
LIVVDSSVVLEILLQTPASATLTERLFSAGETMHAPHLLDVEVVQVLRRYSALGSLDDRRGAQALSDLVDWPIRRYPHSFMLERIWALRANLTAYDAAYVALAELLDAPLLTRDGKIAGAPGHQAHIELI